MKKILATTFAAVVLLATSSAFAQTDTAAHDVTITIPNVAFLRFTATTNANDTAALQNPTLDVVFSPTAADVEAAATVVPSNTPSWGDLKVFVNRDTDWTVVVSFDSTDPFDWANVRMDGPDWNLGTGGQVGSGDTAGWSSLGFGGAGFRLDLQGTETAGTYSGTVTYTLSAP